MDKTASSKTTEAVPQHKSLAMGKGLTPAPKGPPSTKQGSTGKAASGK